MTLGSAGLVLSIALALCLPVVAVSRRMLRGISQSRNHEIGSAVFLQLGAIYAVLLAFIFNEVYAEYVVAAQAVNKECAGLHGAAMLAEALPDPANRRALRTDMIRYVSDVIEREWPEMARSRWDQQTEDAQITLIEDAGRLPVVGDGVTRGALISQLLEAHQSRETRLFEMTLVLPPLVWALLFSITAVLVVLLALAEFETFWPQVALLAAFVGAIAFFLIVIRLLDNPFEGPLALSPEDFRITLERIKQISG